MCAWFNAAVARASCSKRTPVRVSRVVGGKDLDRHIAIRTRIVGGVHLAHAARRQVFRRFCSERWSGRSCRLHRGRAENFKVNNQTSQRTRHYAGKHGIGHDAMTWKHYFVSLITSPPFMTNTTFSIFLTPVRGSPVTAMTSAYLPLSRLPTSGRPSNSEARTVAACSACTGCI